jgi:hypothetical protein
MVLTPFAHIVGTAKSVQGCGSCLAKAAVDESRVRHGCTALPGSSSSSPPTCVASELSIALAVTSWRGALMRLLGLNCHGHGR